MRTMALAAAALAIAGWAVAAPLTPKPSDEFSRYDEASSEHPYRSMCTKPGLMRLIVMVDKRNAERVYRLIVLAENMVAPGRIIGLSLKGGDVLEPAPGSQSRAYCSRYSYGCTNYEVRAYDLSASQVADFGENGFQAKLSTTDGEHCAAIVTIPRSAWRDAEAWKPATPTTR